MYKRQREILLRKYFATEEEWEETVERLEDWVEKELNEIEKTVRNRLEEFLKSRKR